MEDGEIVTPSEGTTPKVIRGALQVIGGAIPFAGGLFSAAAGAWSEKEQERVNKFMQHWLKMIEDEIREKEKTILCSVHKISSGLSGTSLRGFPPRVLVMS